jgi:hypothetical protein
MQETPKQEQVATSARAILAKFYALLKEIKADYDQVKCMWTIRLRIQILHSDQPEDVPLDPARYEEVLFKIDTGSNISILCQKDADRLGFTQADIRRKITAQSFNGDQASIFMTLCGVTDGDRSLTAEIGTGPSRESRIGMDLISRFAPIAWAAE